MLATLKARPALMTMTMTVEDVERTRCVLLRALRELIIEDCQIARLKIQIQNRLLISLSRTPPFIIIIIRFIIYNFFVA